MSDVDAAAYLLVGSGALAAYTGRSLWLAYTSLKWPKTVGQIVTARADVDARPPDFDDRGFTPAAAAWTAAFVYRYNVRGAQRTGTRLRFTPFSFREARRATQKYLPGHGVTVAVHPTDPELAVLEAGPTLLGIVGFAAALLLTLISAVWLIRSVQ